MPAYLRFPLSSYEEEFRRHTDGNTGVPVYEQIRITRRQYDGLILRHHSWV